MPNGSTLQAIIFDFDGVILDTETADIIAWKEVYAQFDQEFPVTEWHRNIGSGWHFNPFDHLEELLGEPIDRAAVENIRREIDMGIINSLPVMPGVLDRIAEARDLGLKLAVASSSDARWLNHHLPRLGLMFHFDAVRTCSDVEGRKKPDPAVFHAAYSAVNVTAQQVIVLEDSLNGIRAAKESGAKTVAIPNEATRPLDFSEADLVIQSLAGHTLVDMAQALAMPLSNS